MDDVRAALDKLTMETGKRYGLTAALPCGPNHIANIDIPHLNTVLDEFHLMTYDFNGAWSELSGVHAPLYYQGWGPEKYSLHDCVRTWHEMGTPMSKINIGCELHAVLCIDVAIFSILTIFPVLLSEFLRKNICRRNWSRARAFWE